LIGACLLEMGDVTEGITQLEEAVRIDKKNVKAMARVARAYEDLGNADAAMTWYERAVEAAPRYSPPKLRLAALYRQRGRVEEARALYRDVLNVNAYDVGAIMGLAELDIAFGTPTSYRAAVQRLEALLEIVPEHVDARVNLAVALHGLGKTDEAINVYRQVLLRNADHTTAALNLAVLLQARGDTDAAADLLARAHREGPSSLEQAVAMFDLLLRQGDFDAAADVWSAAGTTLHANLDVLGWQAWAHAVAERTTSAKRLAEQVETATGPTPLTLATRVLVGLQGQDPPAATAAVTQLTQMGDEAADARRRLLNALQRHDIDHPGDPWTICLAARVLIADGQRDAGRAFTDLCAELCRSEGCDAWVGTLITSLGERRSTSGGR
jgi:tetratricopeptide (TPR) repeat protein